VYVGDERVFANVVAAVDGGVDRGYIERRVAWRIETRARAARG
jgi:hypothetical protein